MLIEHQGGAGCPQPARALWATRATSGFLTISPTASTAQTPRFQFLGDLAQAVRRPSHFIRRLLEKTQGLRGRAQVSPAPSRAFQCGRAGPSVPSAVCSSVFSDGFSADRAPVSPRSPPWVGPDAVAASRRIRPRIPAIFPSPSKTSVSVTTLFKNSRSWLTSKSVPVIFH